QRELDAALGRVDVPACAEDDAKEKGVEREHEQRRDQRPEHAQHGAAVAGRDLTSRELPNEVYVPGRPGHRVACPSRTRVMAAHPAVPRRAVGRSYLYKTTAL